MIRSVRAAGDRFRSHFAIHASGPAEGFEALASPGTGGSGDRLAVTVPSQAAAGTEPLN